MKLILAQGNPGSQYAATRHNAGFYMIDGFAAAHGAQWSDKDKFLTSAAEVIVDGEKVILAKPTTYYNETGRSARALADFYKLDPAEDILVIHDELALPFGTVRTRSGGSDAGNNGVKSLNAALGQEYKRIRIGIWNEGREKMDDVDFVLGRFSREETEALPKLYELVRQQIEAFIADSHVDETVKLL